MGGHPGYHHDTKITIGKCNVKGKQIINQVDWKYILLPLECKKVWVSPRVIARILHNIKRRKQNCIALSRKDPFHSKWMVNQKKSETRKPHGKNKKVVPIIPWPFFGNYCSVTFIQHTFSWNLEGTKIKDPWTLNVFPNKSHDAWSSKRNIPYDILHAIKRRKWQVMGSWRMKYLHGSQETCSRADAYSALIQMPGSLFLWETQHHLLQFQSGLCGQRLQTQHPWWSQESYLLLWRIHWPVFQWYKTALSAVTCWSPSCTLLVFQDMSSH